MKLYYPFKRNFTITQRFGNYNNNYYSAWGGKHPGLDFAGAPFYEPVLACADGNIRLVGIDGGWGLKVVIRHEPKVDTWYCHLAWSDKKMGDKVSKGDVIGYLGSTGVSTGNHLHLAYIDRGLAGLGKENFHDPEYYLNL